MFLSLALFLANSYLPFPFKMNESNDSMENNLASMNITPEIEDFTLPPLFPWESIGLRWSLMDSDGLP